MISFLSNDEIAIFSTKFIKILFPLPDDNMTIALENLLDFTFSYNPVVITANALYLQVSVWRFHNNFWYNTILPNKHVVIQISQSIVLPAHHRKLEAASFQTYTGPFWTKKAAGGAYWYSVIWSILTKLLIREGNVY